jgi:hypothetical protein
VKKPASFSGEKNDIAPVASAPGLFLWGHVMGELLKQHDGRGGDRSKSRGTSTFAPTQKQVDGVAAATRPG